MAWRFVETPNGKLARFSDIIDHFTDYDMTDDEAIHMAIYEHNCGVQTASEKVQNARNEGYKRWVASLRTIYIVHGREGFEDGNKECLQEMGLTESMLSAIRTEADQDEWEDIDRQQPTSGRNVNGY